MTARRTGVCFSSHVDLTYGVFEWLSVWGNGCHHACLHRQGSAFANGRLDRADRASVPFAFASSAQAAVDPSAVYRAVNLNGAAVTVGGVAFEAGTSAPNLTSGPNRFCKQDVTLIPATDAATATMIRCSVYGSAGAGTQVTMTAIPSGSYKVSLYNWEDNNSATFSLALNGAPVATNVVSGPGGTWKLLGPYTVDHHERHPRGDHRGWRGEPVGHRRGACRRCSGEPGAGGDRSGQPDQCQGFCDLFADDRGD